MASEPLLRIQSSMTYWYPLLSYTSAPTPETVKLGAHKQEVDDASEAEGGFTVRRPAEENLVEAIQEVGGPPAFLRSDQMSAKHRMLEGSKIQSDDPDEFGLNVWTVAEQNSMAWGVPAPKAYYVREWLNLWHEYTAFTGTPIAAEVRFFLLDGEIHDWGFYWPKDAIRRPDTEHWEELHEKTVEMATQPNRLDTAAKYAREIGEVFDEGYWSLDFALEERDQWYAIDMARGELSWHPEGVEKARPDPREVSPDGDE